MTHLTVNVTDDLDGRAQLDQRRLTQEHLPRSQTDRRDLGILERRALGHFPTVPSFQQPGDHVVHVERAVKVVTR
jgi:hypothetical protein